MKYLFVALLLLPLPVLTASIAQADIGEIRVDGEVLGPDLFALTQRRALHVGLRCPPHSDKRVRDLVVEHWLVVKTSDERGYEYSKFQRGFIDEFLERWDEKSLLPWSEVFKKDPNMLRLMATQFVANNDFPVTDEAIEAEYKRMIESGDPLVVNVPLIRASKAGYYLDNEESRTKYESVLAGYADGKSWSELLPLFAVNGLTEDIINKDAKEWLTIDNLHRTTTELHALVGDGRSLKAGDLIGPFPPVYDETALVYVHESRIADALPLNVKLNRWPGLIKDQIRWNIKKQQRPLTLKSILADHIILEDGVPFVPGGPYESCPR